MKYSHHLTITFQIVLCSIHCLTSTFLHLEYYTVYNFRNGWEISVELAVGLQFALIKANNELTVYTLKGFNCYDFD